MPEQTLKERTARGLMWGLMNNGSTQLLNLVFGIVLANYLTPAEYGLAGEVAIFSLIASALQQSGFISALVNRKNATSEDYNSVFWFNIVVSAALYIILWFCAPLIVDYFHEPELLWLSRYAFAGFFIASFSIAPRAILVKNLMVKEQTIISVVSLVTSGCVGISMAILGMSYWSVVTQNIVFVLIVSLLSWHFSHFRPSWQVTMQPVRQMFRFSCKILVTDIFNCLYNSLFTFLFGNWYTKREVGTYTQANKWNKMGSDLITGMVQDVAQPMFVQVADDRERQQRAFRKMLRFTSLIAFPSMFGLAMVAPEFITLLIGEKWLPSAQFMQMLCIAGAFMPITALYFKFLISRGRSDLYMWNILSQGVLVLGLLAAIHYFNPSFLIQVSDFRLQVSTLHLMVLTYVAVYILWLAVWHYFVWHEIQLSFWSALKDMLPFALFALVSLGVAFFLTRSISNLCLLLISRILLTALLYFSLLWLSHAKILRESIGYLRRSKV